jgi:hypothetical protein
MPSFIVCLNLLHAGLGVRHVAAIAPRPQQPARDLSQIANDRRGAALYYAQSRVGSDRDGKWFDRRCRYGTPSTTGARPWYPSAAPPSLQLDRTVLPIAEPKRPAYTEIDARKAKMPPRFEVKAPEGAPNVVIVLIDDIGFGATSGLRRADQDADAGRLAQDGLRYNNFHTTALCSPTRAALKSGRNHHTVNMGFITEMATGLPGNTGQIPNATAPLAETLRLNGYSTAAFGKWHETASWEASVAGPFDRWPTRQGFDKFYGFIGGETNQWAPFLYDGTAQVELPNDPNYHFMTDMTDKAVAWIKYQKALTPQKPSFVYFAPGATHAPHHVPKEWIARMAGQGQFDQGWDKLREETLAGRSPPGVVPAGTKLAPKPKAIKDWATLSADEKRLFTRQAEVFAAYAEYTDHEIGRMLKAFDDRRPGRQHARLLHRRRQRHQRRRRPERHVQRVHLFQRRAGKGRGHADKLEQWGGPETYPHMAAAGRSASMRPSAG